MQPRLMESGGVEEILKDDAFVDANKEKGVDIVNISREVYSVLARYMKSEASTVARTVTGLNGVAARRKLHDTYSKRTHGRMFWV